MIDNPAGEIHQGDVEMVATHISSNKVCGGGFQSIYNGMTATEVCIFPNSKSILISWFTGELVTVGTLKSVPWPFIIIVAN